MKAVHAAALAIVLSASPAVAQEYPATVELLTTEKTIVGEAITYPGSDVPAEIHSMVVVMKPGEQSAWHKHGVPLYAYILSGTVSVDYQGHFTKIYRPGDDFMEAMDVWHQATNIGRDDVRILAVFLGG